MASRRLPAGLQRWVLGALAALAAAAPPASTQDADSPSENEVKAAFLYHFAQLVTWPEPAGAPGQPPGQAPSPVVIAVLGRDPFGSRLEATIGRETVRGRPLRIVRYPRLPPPPELPHILFVGSEDPDEAARQAAAVAAAPVLTVGAAKGFAERGGMVEFRLTADARVAFDINLRAVERVGLKMSSQLLKIARIVESRPLRP
jgi:hypothetical protein